MASVMITLDPRPEPAAPATDAEWAYARQAYIFHLAPSSPFEQAAFATFDAERQVAP